MSADLDALCRPPDDFERRMFAAEDSLTLIAECHADERLLIRTLAHALADADPDGEKYRGIRPPDLAATIETLFDFLHQMHAMYTTEREAARATRALLVRLAAQKGRVFTGE